MPAVFCFSDSARLERAFFIYLFTIFGPAFHAWQYESLRFHPIFTNGIFDIRIDNFVDREKINIVFPVSSTLPKDGLPAPSERVFFA
jgi:hypothetical protein